MSVVSFKMTGGEDVTPEEIDTYVSCAHFMAHWIDKNTGVRDKSANDLLDEFNINVSSLLIGPTKGNA